MRPGIRVRLKVRTLGGWKGCGTVVQAAGGVDFVQDGTTYRGIGSCTHACYHELAVMRDQTPNPEHAGTVSADAGERVTA